MKLNSDSSEHFDPADLDWLAWCYLSGELDSGQQAQFESELERNPPVLQALKRAVALHDLTSGVYCGLAGAAREPSVGASPPNGRCDSEPATFFPVAGNAGPGVRPGMAALDGRTGIDPRDILRQQRISRWLLVIAAGLLVAAAIGLRWIGTAVEGQFNEKMLASVWVDQLESNPLTVETWEELGDVELAGSPPPVRGADPDGLLEPDDSRSEPAAGDEDWIFSAAMALGAAGLEDDDAGERIF